jgi:hypothetical protein
MARDDRMKSETAKKTPFVLSLSKHSGVIFSAH